MNERDILIRNLKNLMTEFQLTNEELSYKIGMSKSYITNVINDRFNMKLDTMIKMCDYFGITMKDLFTPNIEQFPIEQSNIKEICNKLTDDVNSLRAENESLKKQLNKSVPKDNLTRAVIQGNETKLFYKGIEMECASLEVGYSTMLANIVLDLDEISIKKGNNEQA